MRRSLAAMVLLAAIGCRRAPAPPPDTPEPPTAQKILAAVGRRYAGARSYTDRGSVATVFRQDDGHGYFTSRLSFETAYDQTAGSFLFEYANETGSKHRAVWRVGSGAAYEFEGFYPETTNDDLGSLLIATAGVSEGTSATIPSLLFGWSSYFELRGDYRLDGIEALGTERCFKISKRRRADDVTTVWVRAADYGIRRVMSHTHHVAPTVTPEQLAAIAAEVGQEDADSFKHMEPFWADETVDYSPSFDTQVPPADLLPRHLR